MSRSGYGKKWRNQSQEEKFGTEARARRRMEGSKGLRQLRCDGASLGVYSWAMGSSTVGKHDLHSGIAGV